MNIDTFINGTVNTHNQTNPVINIRKNQIGSATVYFLYCKDFNVWDSEECKLFLYLKEKLSKEESSPYIGLEKIDGEDKIGIYIVV